MMENRFLTELLHLFREQLFWLMNPLESMLDAEVEKRLQTQSDSEKMIGTEGLPLLLIQPNGS